MILPQFLATKTLFMIKKKKSNLRYFFYIKNQNDFVISQIRFCDIKNPFCDIISSIFFI